jgi:hypothetical protein
MGLELDVSPYGKYIDCGSLTTKSRGKYLDLRECKKQDNCENCIVRSFATCILLISNILRVL